jgi:hypothetical protein
MKAILSSFLVFLTGILYGQSVVDLEYFIDQDPGFGLATHVSISNGTDISRTFTANLGGISEGYHILYIRLKDSNGQWSLTANSPFYKTAVAPGLDVVAVEYFVDNDPGFGNATNVPILPGADLTQSFTASLSNLPAGFHTFYIRSKSADGKWSLTANNAFYLESRDGQEALVKMEYFIDNDPGFGLGTDIPFASSNNLTLQVPLNLSGLSEGPHLLFIRSMDNRGNWSLTARKDFYFCTAIPTASIAGNSLICQGNTVTLSASGGQSYLWSTGDSAATITVAPVTDSLFSVQATDAIGCSDTASIVVQVDVCSSSDYKEASDHSLEIFPNPFTDSFSILSNDKIEQVDIYDLAGKLTFSKRAIYKNTIEMGNFAPGSYLVRILSDKVQAIRSVIKINN